MAKVLAQQREPVMNEMECGLKMQIDYWSRQCIHVYAAVVNNKVTSIYSDLQKKGFKVIEGTTFAASKDWFVLFKHSDYK